jgi:glycosyltransferase involved in cell wall biosynthesis
MHHPFPKGKLDVFRSWQRRLFVKGADRLPSLSRAVEDELGNWGCPAAKREALEWGADVDFYGPWTTPGEGVIATGRTGRDFRTFALAAATTGIRTTIVGLEGQFEDDIYRAPENLHVIETPNQQPVPGEQKGWMKYPELCRHMAAHAVIAIPLYDQKSLVGITSLMDALGLGRAVLMTRNAHVDLDIEAHGIGFWLQPGDVDGWKDRLRWVNEHPEEVKEMGRRARALAESRFNSGAFARRMGDLLGEALRMEVAR